MTEKGAFEEIRELILATLDDKVPTPEGELYKLCQRYGKNSTEAVIGQLMTEDKIRWVHYKGYCLGGRPWAKFGT